MGDTFSLVYESSSLNEGKQHQLTEIVKRSSAYRKTVRAAHNPIARPFALICNILKKY